MIRLFILDDHSLIVDGIRQRLRHQQDGMTVAGSMDDIEKFVQTADADTFDVIILDLWLPGRDPVENLQLLRKHFPAKPVVILTQETSSYWIRVMMEGGVKAYLMKNTDRREFKETIEKVFSGKTIAPVFLLETRATYSGNTLLESDYYLKPTERAIVIQLSRGASLKTIAEERTSSVSAIEKTLRKIRAEYGVTTNPELIRVLISKKLI